MLELVQYGDSWYQYGRYLSTTIHMDLRVRIGESVCEENGVLVSISTFINENGLKVAEKRELIFHAKRINP